MASVPNTSHDEMLATTQSQRTPISRWPSSSRRIWLGRRKLPTVRLGGKKPRRGFLLVRMFRRLRLRWLKLKNSCTLKKLKDYYYSVLKDIIESGGAVKTFQQRLLMETSFAIPVMGLSINTFPH